MSMRDNGATRLRSLHPAPAPATAPGGGNRPQLGLHDYGRLEVAAFEELDMLSPMRPRIAALLTEARVVPSAEIPEDVITLGTTVRYRVDGDRLERRLLTLGRQHVPNGQYVCVLTPVGLALLGRKPGELVEAETFDGGKLRIAIASVEHQPEAEARARMPDGPDDNGPEAA
ncbi:GreA/GreB family elongation factor [Parvibaculum sp.]|uniref:GreA/GreB family elongation factor n=1 Tax=Parvibaculum sp. TaxID=2024848 RepID=UPI003296F03D